MGWVGTGYSGDIFVTRYRRRERKMVTSVGMKILFPANEKVKTLIL